MAGPAVAIRYTGGTHLQCLVDGDTEDEPERSEQHRIDEPRQIGHWISPGKERR